MEEGLQGCLWEALPFFFTQKALCSPLFLRSKTEHFILNHVWYLNHVLGDGIACLNFINTWCDVAWGAPMTSPPLIDRTLLRCRDPPKPKFEHTEFHPPLTMNNTSIHNPTQQQSSCFEILKMTTRLHDTLKTMVNTEDGKTNYSSYRYVVWLLLGGQQEGRRNQVYEKERFSGVELSFGSMFSILMNWVAWRREVPFGSEQAKVVWDQMKLTQSSCSALIPG